MRPRPLSSLAVVTLAFAAAVFVFPASVLAARTPNDSYFDDQWYLRHIRAHEAWTSSLGFEGVTIAIIDSGVDIDHPDLKDNVWRNMREVAGNGIDDDANGYVDDVFGWDFVGDDADPRPDVGVEFSVLGTNHGTIGAGIAAGRGDNGKGVVGVTWQSTIMALRALDSNGSGDPMDVVRAVEYAVRNGAKVINLSFAGSTYKEELAIALRRAYDAGVFVVAAAGNAPDEGAAVDLDARPLYPVCLDRDANENFVYGVAATDDKDVRAPFSNFGAGCVDISAPGTRIISTQLYRPAEPRFSLPYGGYFNGTSLAAAEVSGVVALLLALDHNLTPKQVMNILTESANRIDNANPGYFGKLGRGRVDAARAVEIVLAKRRGEAAPVPTASLLPGGSVSKLVVAAPGPGRTPEVRMFTRDGVFVRSFMAFPESFRGGVDLALGNFDATAPTSFVVGAMAGGTPHVRVFDVNTRPIGGFMAYDPSFTGGVSVAAGDVDGDGKDEIVTGAGPGGGPHVRVFSASGRAVGGFFAFEKNGRGGVIVASGDLDGDRRAEIAAADPAGGRIRVFDAKGAVLAEVAVPKGSVRDLAVSDVDGDGRKEIVARRVERKASVVTAYRLAGKAFAELDAATARPASLSAEGLQAPATSLAIGGARGEPAMVTASFGRNAVARFAVYEQWFKGGVQTVMIE